MHSTIARAEMMIESFAGLSKLHIAANDASPAASPARIFVIQKCLLIVFVTSFTGEAMSIANLPPIKGAFVRLPV